MAGYTALHSTGRSCNLLRRRWLLVGLLCFTVSVIYLFSRDRTLRNTLSYSTRPLWDKFDDTIPHDEIKHYTAWSLPANDTAACARHGWTPYPPPQRPKVYDVIIFSVELEMLELRLKELYDAVDAFVIVESNTTFTGKPKKLGFDAARYAQYRDKIQYFTIAGRALAPGEGPFAIEGEQRKHVTELLRSQVQPPDGSLILMSDVDEIPSLAAVQLLSTCQSPLPLHLSLRSYVYSFEFPTTAKSWRAQVHAWTSSDTWYNHGKVTDNILLDAGWHCSSCFHRISDYQFKMRSYSHSDRLFGNRHWRQLLHPNIILDKICTGKDLFDMLPEAYTWSELLNRWSGETRSNTTANLPRGLMEDQSKFQFLLPGGCRARDLASGLD
ncbi:glycosyltransferase family 17 protein [Moesziomyces antarcticus]|uniref:Glycosyltransferase family 17 protein n=2 Tax=Pseudozyma antarctica TaxID=84753 RepID=A0A081CM48_PSEA2|nr:glycosyltransferase family 17 protein [Moesziomyces antarcticus]GAK67744.1 glycosyltransferase family 17 protein [Moesziomyces antarcticus]SPO49025.1 related to N-acetylglucosaminyltransferase [Moesziomyces antarcticus]